MSGSGTTFLADPGCTDDFKPTLSGNGDNLTIGGKSVSEFIKENYRNSKTGLGLIQESYASAYDGDTKKWTNGAAMYLTTIKNAAGEYDTAYQLKAEQVAKTSDNKEQITDESVNTQYAKDITFIDMAKGEYCYFSSRYAFFLNKFFGGSGCCEQ